jgi:hypothetical protein
MPTPHLPSLRRAALRALASSLVLAAAACNARPDAGDTAIAGSADAAAGGTAAAPAGAAAASPTRVTVTLAGTAGNDGTFTTTPETPLTCFRRAEPQAGSAGDAEYTLSYSEDANPQVKWLNLRVGRLTNGATDRVSGQISAGKALGPGETSTGMLTLNGLAGGSLGRGTARVTRDGPLARIEVDGTSGAARVTVVAPCTVTDI